MVSQNHHPPTTITIPTTPGTTAAVPVVGTTALAAVPVVGATTLVELAVISVVVAVTSAGAMEPAAIFNDPWAFKAKFKSL